MKFTVYARISGRLIRLFKVHRTAAGLYLTSFGHFGDDHVSYHSDGNSWSRGVLGNIDIKKKRQPLTSFSGAETIYRCLTRNIAPGAVDKLAYSGVVKNQDIVADRGFDFAYELILSDIPLSLEPMPDRPNSAVFQITNTFPVITIEFYDRVSGQVGPSDRYRPTTKWEEGKNLWFGNSSRI